MENAAQADSGLYTPITAAPDWLTATACGEGHALAFDAIAYEVLRQEERERREFSSALRFGFEGRKAVGFFHGRRQHDAIIVLSGPRTPTLLRTVARAATNVSRLDVQVTVWTHGEQPNLALQGWHSLARSPNQRGRKGKATLIQTRPTGDTLNVNSRRSDQAGRLYDKATEAKLGPPRTLWRYEVEFKRAKANHYALALASSDDHATLVTQVVHDFFKSKGVLPTFSKSDLPSVTLSQLPAPDRDMLLWFESSVSVTVARAINRYGIPRTLEALGLSFLLPERKEDDSAKSTGGFRSVPPYTRR